MVAQGSRNSFNEMETLARWQLCAYLIVLSVSLSEEPLHKDVIMYVACLYCNTQARS